MNTMRLTLGGQPWDRWSERLLVLDWVGAARVSPDEQVNYQNYQVSRPDTESPQHKWWLMVTWATTGNEEPFGFVRGRAKAEQLLHDLDLELRAVWSGGAE